MEPTGLYKGYPARVAFISFKWISYIWIIQQILVILLKEGGEKHEIVPWT